MLLKIDHDAPQIKGSKIFWFIRIQGVISLRAVFSGFWCWFSSIPDFTCLDGVQFVKVTQYLLHHIWRKLKLFVSLESNHYFAPISVFWIFVSALWILWFHMSLCVDICFGQAVGTIFMPECNFTTLLDVISRIFHEQFSIADSRSRARFGEALYYCCYFPTWKDECVQ